MKQCPECSAEYADGINFCAKDGRSLTMKYVAQHRLCPHCANSVAADAANCPYCKADMGASPVPEWPTREGESAAASPVVERGKIPPRSKVILIAGLITFALGIFLMGLHSERGESQLELQEKAKEIQEREQKIKSMEAELTKTRQDLQDNSNQLADLKTQLDGSKKELAVVQQRLAVTNKELEHLASSRSQPIARTSPRPPDPVSAPTAPPPPSASTRRGADPGVYETLRATSVYEDPSTSARVVAQIPIGIRVNVVRSVGDWLEVRSKSGKPPGFIRMDDARFVSKAN
jgi:hypothetical protein